MAFMGANRMGRLFSGVGSISRGVYNAGKYGMDKALSNRMASMAILGAAGAGAIGFASSHTGGKYQPRSGLMGTVGRGLAYGSMGAAAYGAYKGAYGTGAQVATTRVFDEATALGAMAINRLRRFI